MARNVSISNQFKRDAKKHFIHLTSIQWVEVMNCLIHAHPLPVKYANHPLKGEWKGCMDCHIKPDLVLIYEFDGDNELILHRLGSHSELNIA